MKSKTRECPQSPDRAGRSSQPGWQEATRKAAGGNCPRSDAASRSEDEPGDGRRVRARPWSLSLWAVAAFALCSESAHATPFASWESEGSHSSAAAAGGGEGGPDAAGAKKKGESKGKMFTKLRQILKNEPSCKEVQRAALVFYKLEPERIRRMGVATRVKAIVPEIEGSIDNSIGHTFTNTRDGLFPQQSLRDAGGTDTSGNFLNPDGYKERVQTTTDNLLWRVRAVWNLDRLVFNSEELDVKSLNSLEENLVREVTTLYFQRHRLIANLILSGPDEDEEIFYELLRLDEQTATIDALTGGMFSPRAWNWEAEVKW